MLAFKINGWVGWTDGASYARIYARYIDAMDVDEPTTTYSVAGLTELGSTLTLDTHYSIELLEGPLRPTSSALKLTDEREPLAPHEQRYDAHTGNPLGRGSQVSLRYTLGNC